MANLIPLRQSTAATLLVGPFLDETDGKTAETSLTLSQADFLLWKQGGTTLAQKHESTSATHRSLGYYTVPIDTTDTNTLGILTVAVHESGALPVRQDYTVLPAVVWDEMFDANYSLGLRGILAYGTAQSATGTTIVLASATSLADDIAVGAVVCAYGSTQGYWQTRVITDYVNSSDTATVDTWTVTPSGTVTYVVFLAPPADATNLVGVDVKKINGQTASASGTVTFPNATLASTTNITSATGVDVTKWNGTTVATPDTAGYVKVTIKNGTGAGEIATSSGAVSNVTTTATATAVTTVNGLASNVITAASIASNAITAAKVATDAIGAAQLAADAVTEIQSGLATSSALSTVAGYIDTEVAAIKAKTDNLPASPAAVSDIPTAATIADAVWDEVLSGHTTAGTAGKGLIDSSSAGNPWSTDIASGYTGTQAGNVLNGVKAKTDQLAFTTANQVDAQVKSMATDTLTSGALASSAVTELQTGLATSSALSTAQSDITAIKGAVDTEVAAIKAKTDSLTFTVGGQVDANVQSINDTTVTGNGTSPKFGV